MHSPLSLRHYFLECSFIVFSLWFTQVLLSMYFFFSSIFNRSNIFFFLNKKSFELSWLNISNETFKIIQLPKPKKIQLGNWEAKVLSKDQLHYAATDAFASWYLYEVVSTLNTFRWYKGCRSYYHRWCCFVVKQILRSLPDVEKVATDKTSEEVTDGSPKWTWPWRQNTRSGC